MWESIDLYILTSASILVAFLPELLRQYLKKYADIIDYNIQAIYIGVLLLFIGAIVSIGFGDVIVAYVFYEIYIHPLWSMISFIAFGVFLYGLRENRQFFYGLVEFTVGTNAIYYAISSNGPDKRFNTLIALSSGVYIIVRSLDNMNKDVPENLGWLFDFITWGKKPR